MQRMKRALTAALLASALYAALLVPILGTAELLRAVRFLDGRESIAMTAARAYLGSLYWYGVMAVLSFPFFLLAAITFRAVGQLAPARTVGNRIVMVALATAAKVGLDALFFYPVRETKVTLAAFVVANAIACFTIERASRPPGRDAAAPRPAASR